MKRIQSKASLLKKRVRKVQGKAKFAGVLYLLGTLGLAVATAIIAFVGGAYISPNGKMPIIKTFISEVIFLVKGDGASGGISALLKNADLLVRAVSALVYAVLLLTVVINALRGLGKLNWLFKRRASYSNGFNRNAYAMDDLSKRYASSLGAVIICNLIIFALGGAKFTQFGYYAIIGGLALHFIAGLIEGRVTLFTTGDKIEEEEREHGLFVFFLRNIFQLAIVAGIFVLFVCYPFDVNKSTGANPSNASLGVLLKEVLDLAVVQRNFKALANMKLLVPLCVELLVWICLMVMIKHAVSATEFNRDGLDGAGMKNFAVFSFLGALCLAGLGCLNKFGFGEILIWSEQTLNQQLLVSAGVAFVGFLLDCFIRPRQHGSFDDIDTNAYFAESEDAKYNNTII